MRSLAWNIHLDWARAGPGTNPKDLSTKRFEHWLHLAYQTAFSLASTPLGHAPLEHTGELPYLRPLSKKTLMTTFDLEKFLTKAFYLPLMATLFLSLPVDPYITSNFQNVQLCTQAEADEAIANAAAGKQPEEDDLVATPGMMAFHSSVQRKKREATISIESSPGTPAQLPYGQQKMPPPYNYHGPASPIPSPPRHTTARAHGLPPIPTNFPQQPPQFEQPNFYTGRTALPMSPTRFTRQASSSTTTHYQRMDRPPNYSAASTRLGAVNEY
jgi:hypothetical protein